jgi:hypothetical protein
MNKESIQYYGLALILCREFLISRTDIKILQTVWYFKLCYVCAVTDTLVFYTTLDKITFEKIIQIWLCKNALK